VIGYIHQTAKYRSPKGIFFIIIYTTIIVTAICNIIRPTILVKMPQLEYNRPLSLRVMPEKQTCGMEFTNNTDTSIECEQKRKHSRGPTTSVPSTCTT